MIDLDAIKERASKFTGHHSAEQNIAAVVSARDVPVLVADVDRLRGELAQARQDAAEDYARAEQAETALVASRAVVAQLKADCAKWERLHAAAERLCARCGRELEQQSQRVDL